MNWASGEIVGVLTFLLPGFIAAAVFYSLTSHPKPGAFDRIILALILTLICNIITDYTILPLFAVEDAVSAINAKEPVFHIIVAIVLGLCLSGISNTDILHRYLRRLRLTRETSFPSEWYSTFARYGNNAYIILHLQGGRQLYGFSEEWPSGPKDGHFRLAEAEWLDDDNKRTPLLGASAVLIPAAEVTLIEFAPISGERK